MRIIREIQAGLGISGIASCIDLERSDLPVRRDRPYEQEKRYERGEEEQDAAAPPAALIFWSPGIQVGQAHPRSTLAPAGYDLCFAPARLSAGRYGLVTVP